ncbi:unnamed protein product [Adineta ricciae]|uniref:Uncharacterized protein n=1 Tax=Adineta ricciae TaxID=249248 RepID=A0A815NY79_ADIRI|nr:unnamed protein product [Adineta ricciae]
MNTQLSLFMASFFILIQVLCIITAAPHFSFQTSDGSCSGSCRYSSTVNQCGDGCACIVQWAGHGQCQSKTSKEPKPVGEQCSGTCRYASTTNQCGDGCFCSAKWAGYGACESLSK